MAHFKIDEDFYIDGDQINGIRWLIQQDVEHGVIFFNGNKIVVHDREQYEKIKDAYLWSVSTIYDGKKKITQR